MSGSPFGTSEPFEDMCYRRHEELHPIPPSAMLMFRERYTV